MNRKTTLSLGAVVITLVGLIAAKMLILGGANKVTLNSAPPLAGAVSQSLIGPRNNLPIAGKDFELKDSVYFENNNWVVVNISPLHKQFNPSLAVLEKRNGGYQVVLGPGTAFDNSYLQSLPPEVGKYLSAKGVMYESLN